MRDAARRASACFAQRDAGVRSEGRAAVASGAGVQRQIMSGVSLRTSLGLHGSQRNSCGGVEARLGPLTLESYLARATTAAGCGEKGGCIPFQRAVPWRLPESTGGERLVQAAGCSFRSAANLWQALKEGSEGVKPSSLDNALRK